MFFGISYFSFVSTRHKGGTRIPWECWNLLSPLQGHIGAKLYLEGLDMSLHGKIPRELLILLCPLGGQKRIHNSREIIPGNYLSEKKFKLFFCRDRGQDQDQDRDKDRDWDRARGRD